MSSVLLITGDATKLKVATSSVDLIITHPPYLGASVDRYSKRNSNAQINASQDKKKMLKLMLQATKEMERVLKPTGSIWIANGKQDGFDTDYVSMVINKTKLKYVDFIVQNSFDYANGVDSQEKIAINQITTWHHFQKGIAQYFNPFEVKKYNNPVWDLPENNLSSPIDTVLDKDGHFVLDSMNEQIPERLIKMFSKGNHVVLDPFGGSGVVAQTAARLGRMAISNDISSDQTKIAIDRMTLANIQYKIL